MMSHEFGIMPHAPVLKERHDQYVPKEYHAISVHDDFIEPILTELEEMDCYWHTLEVAGKGLAYCGITLIPPASMDKFISILVAQNQKEYVGLIALAKQALKDRKYIIHFGI